MEENKQLVKDFYGEALETKDLSKWDNVLSENYQHHDENLPPELQTGRENYKKLMSGFFAAFPDLKMEIEGIISEGDMVGVRMHWSGTNTGEMMGNPPTNKSVKVSMMSFHRIDDGKIVEGWVNFDSQGMMNQLSS